MDACLIAAGQRAEHYGMADFFDLADMLETKVRQAKRMTPLMWRVSVSMP